MRPTFPPSVMKSGKLSGKNRARQSLSARFLAWLGTVPGQGGGGWPLPRAFPLFLFLFGFGMILISLVGDQGLIAYSRLKSDEARLREEVADLKQHMRQLNREIQDLRLNPAYQEYLARKRLGLVKPGETVIQLPIPRNQP